MFVVVPLEYLVFVGEDETMLVLLKRDRILGIVLLIRAVMRVN